MKYKSLNRVKNLAGLLLLFSLSLCFQYCSISSEKGIVPYTKNPNYWQNNGKPVFLAGLSKDDNLFQVAGLKAHLAEIHQAGGNYIRNTMSSRKGPEGNEVRAFQIIDGKYDLEQFNPVYWDRFEKLLQWTKELDIIVQVEIWATHDLFGEEWDTSPWNPINNYNYSETEVSLDIVAPERAYKEHTFFYTVPGKNNDNLLLHYQQDFVNKLLSLSLSYDHILYCITNEIQPAQPPEWSKYWAVYISEKALEAGRSIEVTEMFWSPDFKDPQHRTSLDNPEIFSFFEISQNSANESDEQFSNLQYVMSELKNKPSPYFPDSFL
jgi:hypothetical protein